MPATLKELQQMLILSYSIYFIAAHPNIYNQKCGPMPKVMAALPNIGSTPLFNAAEFG